MRVTVSFRHAPNSPAAVARVEQRALSIANKLDRDCRLRVVCARDAGHADVDIVGRVAGRELVAHADDSELYDALDAAFDHLSHQALRAHDKRIRRRRRAGRLPA